VVCMTVLNVSAIAQVTGTVKPAAIAQEQPRIPLSKTGKNVVVLMMDRAA